MKKLITIICAAMGIAAFGEWCDDIDTTMVYNPNVWAGENDESWVLLSVNNQMLTVSNSTLSVAGLPHFRNNGQYPDSSAMDLTIGSGALKTYSYTPSELPADFDANALIHLDASIESTLIKTNDDQHICRWLDCRSTSDAYAWTDDPANSNGFMKDYPAIKSGDASLPDGTYVDFGEYMEGGWGTTASSYMYFQPFTTDTNIREGFLVLKINNGMSFFLGSTSYTDFHRGSAGQILTGDFGGYWRSDGARVSSGTYTQEGRFHVISFALGGPVHANTFALDRFCRGGGCAIAEVILFNEQLSEERRHAIDAHLMKKWLNKDFPSDGKLTINNLAYGEDAEQKLDVAGDSTVVAFTGRAGTFTKDGAGALSIGAATGITGVDVREGSLSLKGTIPAVFDEAFIWLDPSDESTLLKDESGRVMRIADVRGLDRNYATNSIYSAVSGATLKSFGPKNMPVLDMGDYGSGETRVGMIWNRQCPSAKTIFVVAARNQNHGEQFLLGQGEQFCFHADSDHYLCSSALASGYYSGNAVHGATWNIDGENIPNGDALYSTVWPVDQLQVFSISDCNYNGQGAIVGQLAQDRTFRYGGLSYGEVIVFERQLSAIEVKKIRDYLLDKWLGKTVDSYGSSYSEVSVASDAQFIHDGAYTIPENGTMSFGLPTRETAAFAVAGDVEVGKNVTVELTVDAGVKPPVGQFALVSCTGEIVDAANLSTWTATGSATNGRRVKLLASNGQIVASLAPSGMAILIR